MSTRSSIAFGAAGLLFAALPALAKTPQKVKPKVAVEETAIIENTGSTNTKGYQIVVGSTGATLDGRAVSLPAALQKQFFQDLDFAAPLAGLPARRGMRSASFGTRTFITYKGQRSPDLTFGGNAQATALKADVDAITRALGVSNSPRRPAQPVAPQPDAPAH